MNKEITIYELLGLIKDNKQPSKVQYKGYIYTFCDNNYINIDENYLLDIVHSMNDDIDIPNVRVEILDEENDEFEDIEFEDLWELTPYQECTSRGDIIEAINQLIRNQKKIIEKLERLNKDE